MGSRELLREIEDFDFSEATEKSIEKVSSDETGVVVLFFVILALLVLFWFIGHLGGV